MALRCAPISFIPCIAAEKGKATLRALAYYKKKGSREDYKSDYMSLDFSP